MNFLSPKRPQRNLDHLIISVRKTDTSPLTQDYALNGFLSDNGRRSNARQPADYDYEAFRRRLRDDLDIAQDVPLQVRSRGLIDTIPRRIDFDTCLLQIQSGMGYIPLQPEYGLLCLELSATDMTGPPQTPTRTNRPPPGGGGSPDPSLDFASDSDIDTGTPNVRRRLFQTGPPETPRQRRQQASPKAPETNQAPAPGDANDQTSGPSPDGGDGGDEDGAADGNENQDENNPNPNDSRSDSDLDLGEAEVADESRDEPDIFDNHAPTSVVTPEEWRRACQFFNRPESDLTITVDGITLELELYQAYAVWRTFTQIGDNTNPSFMIGDDPGLGKTGVSITTAVIFATLQDTWREVQEEWRLTGNRPKNHLRRPPREGSSNNPRPSRNRCPTQGTRILCPCVSTGLSYRIVSALNDFPTVVCCPATLIQQWYYEFDKWVDHSDNSPARRIEVFAHRNELQGQGDLKLARSDVIKRTKGTFNNESKLQPQPGKSSTIFIISASNARAFRDAFQEPIPRGARPSTGRRTKKAKTKTPEYRYSLGCGLIFFDEFHKYRGAGNTTTQPFELLEAMRQSCPGMVMAVGLSGSLRHAPNYWRPFVVHAFAFADRAARDGRIGGLTSAQDLSGYDADFSYLVANRNQASNDDRTQRDIETRQERIDKFFGDFIPLMMIARKKTDTFLGEPIGGRPLRINLVRRDMAVGRTRNVFRELVTRVRAYHSQLFRREVDRWIKNGRPDPKPDKKEFMKILLQQTLDNTNNTRARGEYNIISRASCFPYVAVLHEDKLVQAKDFVVDEFRPIANNVSRALHPSRLGNVDFGAVNDYFQGSPFYNHRRQLKEESPKIQWVEGYIRKLIKIRSQPVDSPQVLEEWGPPPPDGTNCRHALVFSDSPLSAFLTMMTLWEAFRNEIEAGEVIFLYAHSGVSVAHRADYTRYMQASCQNDNRVKVLISTMGIYGEGHNLQRANSVIITEVPTSFENQKQMFSRCARKGQVMRTFLFQLFDNENLMERTRETRNRNRKLLADKNRQEEVPDLEQVFIADTGINLISQEQFDAIDPNGRIDSYASPEAQIAALRTFPRGEFRRAYTSGDNNLCGVRAVIGAIRSQLEGQNVPVPDENDLITMIYAVQVESGTIDHENFSADQVHAGLREWSSRYGHNDINFRLGYIQPSALGHEAVLLDGPGEGREVIVWVYLTATGDNGHFEILTRPPDSVDQSSDRAPAPENAPADDCVVS
ncbi:hypothetical protein F5Y10DRAFT_265255 [Nemania abortiva]|nr:hypothetical protein F5Y10DRAFT_265255 [Nemania abortiva]